MLILGIETSCDETAVAILEVGDDNIKLLSSIVSSQVAKHAKFGGVVPSLAAREHIKNLPHVLKQAMVNFDFDKIDLISVTAGPGLIPALLVGTAFARALAWKYKKPIIGVNHVEGHILSNWLSPILENSKSKILNPKQIQNLNFQNSKKIFPALCLVVSGGHTQLILMKDFGKYKIVGETLDDAAGEAFDKIARLLELGYPGGPAIAAEAAKFKAKNEKLKIELPRPMLNSKDFNFSFAGLKTAVLYSVRNLLKDHSLQEIQAEMTHEAQEAIVDVLTQKTLVAARKFDAKSIMLSGGVSANKLLREKIIEISKKLDVQVSIPEMAFTGDNAAMIALAGYINYKKSKKYDWKKVEADANWAIV